MQPLKLDDVATILCLGAHSDDIEIGCGGTVLRLLEESPAVRMHWVVFSASGDRAQEAEASAERFIGHASETTVELHEFRDGFLPYDGGAVKERFEDLKRRVRPDLIFTHHRHDLHQDHRLVCELTWNTFRDHRVLEYEVPKWDGDLGRPNLYFPLEDTHGRTKVEILLDCFASQRDKRWFSAETFRGLMRIRGVECNAPSGYAEGFYARKLTL
jgi:LmbE family N-acetylglucosaminyl deacetylase